MEDFDAFFPEVEDADLFDELFPAPGLPIPAVVSHVHLAPTPRAHDQVQGGLAPRMAPLPAPAPRPVAPAPAPAAAPKATGGDDKRAMRLARNRESARQSRARKKEHMKQLEEKVAMLSVKLDNTRRQLFATAGTALVTARLQLLAQLEQLANKRARTRQEDTALATGLQKLQTGFGPDSHTSRVLRQYHFDELDELVAPPYMRFLLWIATQPDEFFSSGTSGKRGRVDDKTTGLWDLVCQELGLSAEQAGRLHKELRAATNPASAAEAARLQQVTVLLKSFRTQLAERAANVQRQSVALHSCLSSEQAVRFQTWLRDNQQRLQRSMTESSATAGAGATPVSTA